jgi:hypothetical protein
MGRRRQVVLWLLAVLTVASSLTLPFRFREMRSASWPFTEGLVTHSAMAEGDFNGRHAYQLDLAYLYFADGRELTGSRLDFDDPYRLYTLGEVGELLKQYPKAKKVRVYFDRGDPTVAVLRPGLTSEGRRIAYVNFAMVAVFGLAFAGVMLQWRRAARRKA